MGHLTRTRIYYVGESFIHGKGLFAARPIAAGVRIGRLEGPRTQRDGPHVLWIEEDDGTTYGIRGENELKYVNHARRPNAEFLGDELWSIAPIARGEEITFHYGEAWDD